MCVCVCVCECLTKREIERERDRKRVRGRERERYIRYSTHLSLTLKTLGTTFFVGRQLTWLSYIDGSFYTKIILKRQQTRK